MTRSVVAMFSCACLTSSIAGCSVTGKWERIATDPPQAMFPVDSLTLDRDQKYTAQWEHRGRKLGSTGTYQYRRGTLSVAESGREPRDYRARRRLDGTLELTYTINGQSIKAILRRTPHAPPNKDEKPTPPKANAER